MRVAVLGAGLAGTMTAYELFRDGHEPIVIDRRSQPASETSYGNAGMIAPGHAFSWASPAALKTLLRSIGRNDTALRFKLQADPHFWRWALRFVRNCTTNRAAYNTVRKVGLCLYSQSQLHRVVEETGVAYGAVSGGALYLHRDPAALERGDRNADIMRRLGVEVRRVTPVEAARIDPVYLPIIDRFAGALYVPGDESGDARLFTRQIADWLTARGVQFRMNESIQRIETSGKHVGRIVTDKGEVQADAYVLALGCYAATVGRTIGVDLPIYPVKGYSVTIPIAGRNNPPHLSGVDEHNLFAFANYGEHVRLTAIAEFAGYDWSHKPSDFAGLLTAARELFPDAGDYDQAEFWAGLRPMTPSALPIFGRARYDNLWVNAGHGHMGWTWACGSGRITADLIAGKEPAHDVSSMLHTAQRTLAPWPRSSNASS
ncbi:MAG TPA: D-amino acid dehydrogenase [Geminicoccus sp.]|jgi:D-amino-acid dehydrogenase|uniref:D-amino acid dehydrogenase n=1 Tax=Geminicoccus sp. TaxID=2024832 RepID=UPI002E321F6B|nr:D-amino acid dehydrogenase [Geminicoccus sp.]HEX2528473.1 D-amino acid dehydrogenase [Geminicoccus sp.]